MNNVYKILNRIQSLFGAKLKPTGQFQNIVLLSCTNKFQRNHAITQLLKTKLHLRIQNLIQKTSAQHTNRT